MSGLRSPYRKNGSCWDEGLCCSLDLMHNGGPWLSCAFRSTSGNLLGSKGRWRKSQGHHGGLDAQKVQNFHDENAPLEIGDAKNESRDSWRAA